MNLTIIVAVSENNVIGINNQMPWHIPEDLKRFKELTLNCPVIMGENTFNSLPENFRPLPKRKNIVLSYDMKDRNGIYIARSIEESIELTEGRKSYIIGGEMVYKQFLPLVRRLELTRVHKDYEGDAFFPEVDFKEWNLINKQEGLTNDGLEYSFLTYDRI